MHDTESELYRAVLLDDVPSGTPRRVEITATDEERLALARRFGDISISHLSGCFNLTLSTKNTPEDVVIVNISGEMDAHVIQQCVVTFEPVESTIQVKIDGIVATSETDQGDDSSDSGDDVEEGPELLGLITNDTIDVGTILAEQLALELDPFPRKTDASFEGYQSGNSSEAVDEKPNPFAELAKLKDNPE